MKKRRLFLAGLWLISLIAISVSGSAASYGFFWTVTLVGPVSLLYLAAVIYRFKIYQELESRDSVSGRPVPYFFVLQNEDRFAFTSVSVRMFSSFSYVEDMPDGTEYELLPGDKFTWHTNLINKYRGEYEVGVKEIVVKDFFGLFSLRYKNPGTIKALVAPRYVRLAKLKTISDLADYLVRESLLAKNEPALDVRDYVSGDDIRLIHWKSSAKQQRLMVRNRTGEEKRGLSVFMDTCRYSQKDQEYLPLENKMLEVLLAVGGYFAEKDTGFGFYCMQQQLTQMQVNGLRDFDAFYHFCAGISFTEGEKTQDAAERLSGMHGFFNSSVLIFVLHTLSDPMLALTERLISNGSAVVIYLITDADPDPEKMPENARRRIVAIPVLAELEGFL